MDNQPIENNTETENIPHSGNLTGNLQERPVDIFDKTPLDQAVAENLLSTHNTAEFLTGEPAPLAVEAPKKKTRRNLFFGGIATGLVGAVITTGAFLSAPSDNSGNAPIKGEPVPALPLDDGDKEPVSTGFEVYDLPTVAEIEINAEQSEEEVAEDVISTISQWWNTGATKEMSDAALEGDNVLLSTTEYATKVSETVDPVFAEALFGENASNPDFQEAITLQETIHNATLVSNYVSYGANSETPYFKKIVFTGLDSYINNEDGSTTLYVNVIQEDNADRNVVGEVSTSGNGHESHGTIVVDEVDGKIKIVQPPVFFAN